MPQVSSYPQGAPSWAELATSDEQAALGFYSQLFGWEDEAQKLPEGMGFYHLQTQGGEHIAAISAQQPDEAAQGVPPHWNTYLSVDDVDATTSLVKDAGGALLAEPFDVMDAGRMAVHPGPDRCDRQPLASEPGDRRLTPSRAERDRLAGAQHDRSRACGRLLRGAARRRDR